MAVTDLEPITPRMASAAYFTLLDIRQATQATDYRREAVRAMADQPPVPPYSPDVVHDACYREVRVEFDPVFYDGHFQKWQCLNPIVSREEFLQSH